MKCINCKIETKNKKFCSRSCSVIYNNKLSPKRKKKIYYCECGNTKLRSDYKYCNNCTPWKKILTLSKGNLIQNRNANSSGYAQIRAHARQIYKEKNQMICYICKYSLHVDICHIKSIKSFNDQTLISEINAPSNLISLCKNHHWELDSGYISL